MPCEESDSVSRSVICSDQHQPPAKQLCLESDHDILSYMSLPSVAKTDSNKYQLIMQCILPENTYKFPKDANTGRSFQYQWLAKYSWLRYSKSAMVGFVLPVFYYFRALTFVLTLMSLLLLPSLILKELWKSSITTEIELTISWPLLKWMSL